MTVTITMLTAWLGHSDVAGAEPRVRLEVSGTCPTREALIEALDTVLTDYASSSSDPGEPAVIVSDDGSNYRVEIRGTTRTFAEWPPHCDERARKVAVVVALALEPPVIEAGAPDVTAPQRMTAPQCMTALQLMTPEQVAVERELSATGLAIQIETGAVVDGGLFSGGAASTGAGLQLAMGRRDRKFVIGVTSTAPVLLAEKGGRVSVRRTPLDLALRVHLGGDRIALVLDLGPRFTIQQGKGTHVVNKLQAFHVEPGARLAGRLEVWPWRLYGAYLAVQGEFVPMPSRLMMPGRGMIGEMPAMWVGASVGIAVNVN
jgi:hypothetical protein